MRWPRVLVVAAVGAACFALSGCASGGQVVNAGGVTILVGQKSDDAAAALLTGKLAEVSGCLGVDTTVVVWPHGTSLVRQDPLIVEVPGVGRVGIGDDVSLGGGMALDQYPVPRNLGDFKIAGVRVPARCTVNNVWLGG